MFFYSSFFNILFFSSTLVGFQSRLTNVSLDSVYIRWCEATRSSLSLKASSKSDSIGRHYYENRLATFDRIRDKKAGYLDTSSLRYTFLRVLFHNQGLTNKRFYILEASLSGAKTVPRNFVVYPNSSENIHVDIFVFGINGWFKQGQVEHLNCKIDSTTINYESKKGFNDDDIIVTKFNGTAIEYSNFYLFGTISQASAIKKIVDSYKTENFFKQ